MGNHTITPKLKLSDAERNVSLSVILKSCILGNCLTIMSMHMILAPKQQASGGQRNVAYFDVEIRTYATHGCHNPSSCIVVESHLGCRILVPVSCDIACGKV